MTWEEFIKKKLTGFVTVRMQFRVGVWDFRIIEKDLMLCGVDWVNQVVWVAEPDYDPYESSPYPIPITAIISFPRGPAKMKLSKGDNTIVDK